MPKLTIELDEQTLRRLQQRAQRESRSVEETAATFLQQVARSGEPVDTLLIQYLLAQEKRFALNYAGFDVAYLNEAGEPVALIEATSAPALWRRVQTLSSKVIDKPLLLVCNARQIFPSTTLLQRFHQHPSASAVGFLTTFAGQGTFSTWLPVSEERIRALETLRRLVQPPVFIWMDIVLNPFAHHEWSESLWGAWDAVYVWDAQARRFLLMYDAATRQMRRAIAQALRNVPPAPKPPSTEWRQQLETLLRSVHQHTAHVPQEDIEADVTAAFEEYRRECGL